MSQEKIAFIDRLVSAQEIRKLKEAFRLLYGVEPVAIISGHYRDDKDGLCFLTGGEKIIAIGNKYVTVLVDGLLTRIDPTSATVDGIFNKPGLRLSANMSY